MVRIQSEVYNSILYNTPFPSPETGGILGRLNGVVTSYISDIGVDDGRIGKYVPSIPYLNEQIRLWYDQNIMFCGIYHTHFEGDIKLSGGDILYITNILKQFQPYVDDLLFPLVFPQKEIIFYGARLQNGIVKIHDENVLIVK